MAHEKVFTAKQAAVAVLEKVSKLVKASKLEKSVEVTKIDKEFANLTSLLKGEKPFGSHTTRRSATEGIHGHAGHIPSGPGISEAGQAIRGTPYKGGILPDGSKSKGLKTAITEHKRVLGEIKNMPSPDLGKGEGYKPENSKKENAKPSEHGAKDADQHAEGPAPKGEIHPKEKEQAPVDGTRTQTDPMHNPKEKAEGNNELAGTTPTQVGQDGKNLSGFDEMRGHLKLAKFIGYMEAKRISKAKMPVQ